MTNDSAGVLRIRSAYAFDDTVQRLLAALAERGIKVFAAIDHVVKHHRFELALEQAKRRLRDPLHEGLMSQAKRYQVLDEAERKVVLGGELAKFGKPGGFAVVAQNRAQGRNRVQS